MRIKRWLVLLFAFGMIAAACGDSGEELTGSVEVMWVRASDSPEGMAMVEGLAAFTADTGVDVNYQGVGDDLPTIVSTRVEGGDPPDVAILPQPGLLTDLVTRGALVDVGDAAGGEVDDNYAEVWRDLGTRDGTLYGVWVKASNKSTVFYHVPTFDSLGLTTPETWEELKALCGTLLDNGVTCFAIGGADGWTLSDWYENVLVRTGGIDAYEGLTTGTLAFDGAEGTTAAETMLEILGVEEWIAGGASGALQKGFVDSVTAVFGANQEAAMVFEGDFVGSVAAGETGAEPLVDYNFFPFPSIDGSPPAVMGGGDVAVAFNDRPETLAMIEFMASPAFAEVLIPFGGFNTPNQGADLELYPDDISRASAESLVNAEIFVFDLSDLVPAALGATAGAGIWGQLQNLVENPGNSASILADLQAEAAAAHAG